ATTPIEPTDVQRTEAEQLKIVLKRSRQETHISQQSGSGTDEGTAGAGKDDDENDDEDDDDNDEEEELAKSDEEEETGKGGKEVRESESESDEEESKQEEEESFDPIPRTPEKSEEESNNEEDQELRLRRGLQVTQNVEDSHVTLTPVNPDGPQESSSMSSSFVTSILNPTSDVGVESIFTTAFSPIVSLPTPTPIMTPSTIATISTSSEAPIPPPTIPSIILDNLLTFNSAFRFEERLRSLETSFSEYIQTNLFADAVSAIPGIVQQFMAQQMTEAVREAVQI
nr:hypothetical protein [Tanacetum cinerariifolium]